MLTKARSQWLRSLRDKKNRETEGRFIIEGEKVVAELLGSGFAFEKIYTTAAARTRLEALAAANQVVEISETEMGRASHFPTPSDVLAVGKIEHRPIQPEELATGLTLALDGVRDAGNVGTLLRIADWFRIDRVLLSPHCADLFHQKVINSSMGSFARVRVHVGDLPTLLAQPGVPVLGCVLDGEDVHAIPALRDAVIIIGSEGEGLSPAVAACITRRVTIPRFGGAESLNAAVAAAVVCDNLRRVQNPLPH